MDRDAIADVIARERLFLRPSDGQPPPSDQLRLRARKYPQIFECSDKACSRIRLRTESTLTVELPARAETGSIDPLTIDKYAQQRRESAQRYKPETVRLLLVAEAPPSALDRYFYFENVAVQDSLFRYVVRSVLGEEPSRISKPELLQKLRDQGVFLIDVKEDPSDKAALATHVPDLISRVSRLDPECVILIKATVYDAAYRALLEGGLPVVDQRIPFPGSGRQREFEETMAQALSKSSFR
jgi:hypothetical protein